METLYQAWLLETWTTHATMMSAEPYFEADTVNFRARLDRVARLDPSGCRVVGGIAVAVHTSLASYEKAHPAAFPGRLQAWEKRLERIMTDVRQG